MKVLVQLRFAVSGTAQKRSTQRVGSRVDIPGGTLGCPDTLFKSGRMSDWTNLVSMTA